MPISKRTSYLGQTELTEYVAIKNGLSRSLSKRVIQDVCDFIVIGLIQSPHKVYLPRLGTFELLDPNFEGALGLDPNGVKFELSGSTAKLFDPTLVETETSDSLMEAAV